MVLMGSAVLFAFIAVWIVKLWVGNLMGASASNQDMVAVVVATDDIPFAAKIGAEQVKTIKWPKAHLPVNYFSEPKDLIGKVCMQTIYKGSVVNRGQIRGQNDANPLSSLIQPSMRAVAVRVNDVVGLSGFLLPGNYVDVLATPKPKNAGQVETHVVVENIKILAVDQTVDQAAALAGDKGKMAKTVTLEVSPGQAELLVSATILGTIQLVLRNPQDRQEILTARAPVAGKLAVAAPAAKERPVVILRGARRSTVLCTSIDCKATYD